MIGSSIPGRLYAWYRDLWMRGRIFLSFSSAQRDDARRIATALRNAGFMVFFDETDLPPGGDYIARIETGIKHSDAIVFLLSPDALNEGKYTRTEFIAAERRWPAPVGHVLTVMIRDFDLVLLPPYLAPLTVLQPQGSVEAEVVSAVSLMRKWSRKGRRVVIGATGIALGAAALAWVIMTVLDRRAVDSAVASVELELNSNVATVEELRKNAITFGNVVRSVAMAVRTPGIDILAGLFPPENIDTTADRSALANLYNERIDWLAQSKLTEDTVQRRRATEACGAIVRITTRTRTTVMSLADLDGSRYAINDTRWSLHRETVLGNRPAQGATFGSIYDRLGTLRRSYDRVAEASVEYLDAMKTFCANLAINRATLGEVLAAERLAFWLIVAHLDDLAEADEILSHTLDTDGLAPEQGK